MDFIVIVLLVIFFAGLSKIGWHWHDLSDKRIEGVAAGIIISVISLLLYLAIVNQSMKALAAWQLVLLAAAFIFAVWVSVCEGMIVKELKDEPVAENIIPASSLLVIDLVLVIGIAFLLN